MMGGEAYEALRLQERNHTYRWDASSKEHQVFFQQGPSSKRGEHSHL